MTTEQERDLKRAMDAALKTVRAGMIDLDSEMQADVKATLERYAERVSRVIKKHQTADGSVPPYNLPALVGEIELLLMQLRDEQLKAIAESVRRAAENGSQVIDDLKGSAKTEGILASAISGLPDQAATAKDVLESVLHALYEDGLTISDRVWRNWQALREELVPLIQSSVIQGETARNAARELLLRTGKASDDLITQIEMAKAGAISKAAEDLLASDEARAYSNAVRVFRTEMDRANILASRAAIYATEGVVGTRFLLSPAHPRFDICDMHASVNLYGLGRGVYPPGASPLPAHPNTLSYEEAVFEWEVAPEDRNKETQMEWLQARPDYELQGVLQSKEKISALRAGILQPEEITLPWRELQTKYGLQSQLQ